MADPIWDDPKVANLHKRPSSNRLKLRAASLPDPATIPPRQWLYGTQLLRGLVSVLVAPGGTGKSAYAMAIATAIASGRPILGENIFASVNVAVLNLEDPLHELDRRLAAICMRHKVCETEIAGRIFLHSNDDGAITMGAMSDDGFEVIHPDEGALVEEIKANDIGLLIVDPYAESHTLEENSNSHMVAAAAAWRRLARATDCAVLLVHHVRKGPAIDIDAARGAKGLTDSARVGLLLSPMTEAESEEMKVPPEQRWQYVRLDNAKANLAPRANRAPWYRLAQEDLRNGTPVYPNGDKVAVVVAWKPPDTFAGTTPAELNAALDIIAAGPSPDSLYSASKRGGSSRWAGTILQDECAMSEGQAANVINSWLHSGLLVKTVYRDKKEGRDRPGVRVDNAKRPTL
jgi:hypothetical protein